MNEIAIPSDITNPCRRLLHVGCGKRNSARLPACFREWYWQEIRFDIDPMVEPDMIGSLTDLSAIADGSMDALYSSHNLEHLHAFEVPQALAEFKRVLKPEGFALITIPDLRAIARHIADDMLGEMLYQSASGPITPLDVVFGHQASLHAGHRHMAHRTGFSARTLGQYLIDAGFETVRVHEGNNWDLWALATMPATDENVFDDLAGVMQ